MKNLNFYDLRLLSKNSSLFSPKLIPRFILGVLDTWVKDSAQLVIDSISSTGIG